MLRWLLLASLAVAAPASAKWQSVAQVAVTGTTDFVGPGDIVASATAWYGLRGYSAAVASTGTQKAVNVRRQSDNATSDILIKTGGELDLAAAAGFAGTDATCQGTIASTTMALTGCSGTPAANDPVSGGGIVQPAYIVSCGSFVAGAGSCTLNATQTVSVAETITMQAALFVTKWYDQTGGGNDEVQATAANQPQLLISCLPTLPCLFFNGTNGLATAGSVAASVPFSHSWVGERTAGSGTAQALIVSNSGSTINFFNTVPDHVAMYGGSTVGDAGGATENILHSIQMISLTPNSIINVDGTQTSSINGNALAGVLNIGQGSGGPDSFFLVESGIWPVGFSGGNQTSMHANQSAYWGTP